MLFKDVSKKRPSTIPELLEDRLNKRGAQEHLARSLGLSASTISGWKNGSIPDFESCLRIADYFKIDPVEVFQMAGKPEYGDLYRKFFPDYEPTKLTERDLYPEILHAEIHERVQGLLNKGLQDEVGSQIDILESSHSDFRLREVVRLSEAKTGALCVIDGEYWVQLESINMPSFQCTPALIQENPDDWEILTNTEEGDDYKIGLHLFLERPTIQPFLKELIDIYLGDWMEGYLKSKDKGFSVTTMFVDSPAQVLELNEKLAEKRNELKEAKRRALRSGKQR